MKDNIHPKWFPEAKIVCSCGNTFTMGATKEKIEVEICSACHPFFTGEMKYVDTAGRVQRFQQRQQQASDKKYVNKKERKLLKKLQNEKEEENKPKSFREMLEK